MPDVSDPFAQHSRGLSSPAEKHFAVVPSNDLDLPIVPRVLCALSDGFVDVLALDAITNLPTRQVYPIFAGVPFDLRVTRVFVDGTTVDVMGWL